MLNDWDFDALIQILTKQYKRRGQRLMPSGWKANPAGYQRVDRAWGLRY